MNDQIYNSISDTLSIVAPALSADTKAFNVFIPRAYSVASNDGFNGDDLILASAYLLAHFLTVAVQGNQKDITGQHIGDITLSYSSNTANSTSFLNEYNRMLNSNGNLRII